MREKIDSAYSEKGTPRLAAGKKKWPLENFVDVMKVENLDI